MSAPAGHQLLLPELTAIMSTAARCAQLPTDTSCCCCWRRPLSPIASLVALGAPTRALDSLSCTATVLFFAGVSTTRLCLPLDF